VLYQPDATKSATAVKAHSARDRQNGKTVPFSVFILLAAGTYLRLLGWHNVCVISCSYCSVTCIQSRAWRALKPCTNSGMMGRICCEVHALESTVIQLFADVSKGRGREKTLQIQVPITAPFIPYPTSANTMASHP
jgi:hypothetical protein